mgnify:FL=1
MKENQPRQTDQQATNAALAALAAAGNSFALGQLWEVNKGFLHRLFWQWYSKNKAVADNAGLTLEDFDQEAFFAVQAAAIAYTPEKGAFTTLLYYYVQSQINKAVCGEHRRNITTEDGRVIAVSANPLNECSSLDARLDETDEGSSTKGETIEDPAATQAFQTAEDDLYTEELHNALEDAMTKNLTDKEAHVLRRRYYDGRTLRAIGEELGVHFERIRQIERRACQKLSGLSAIQRWHDDVISTRAWRGTGWNAWSRYGSVQERTAEYLEEKEERFNYYAWRDQMIREHCADLEAAGYFDRHPEWRASLEPRTNPEEPTPPGGEV